MKGSLGLAGNIEIIAGIQSVIPEIFGCASVHRVGSALGHDIDHTTRVAPILGLEVGNHVYFGYSVEGQNRGRSSEHACLVYRGIVTEAVVHVSAVEQIVVGSAPSAVHREL